MNLVNYGVVDAVVSVTGGSKGGILVLVFTTGGVVLPVFVDVLLPVVGGVELPISIVVVALGRVVVGMPLVLLVFVEFIGAILLFCNI